MRNGAASHINVTLQNGAKLTNDVNGVRSEPGTASEMTLVVNGATFTSNASAGVYFDAHDQHDDRPPGRRFRRTDAHVRRQAADAAGHYTAGTDVIGAAGGTNYATVTVLIPSRRLRSNRGLLRRLVMGQRHFRPLPLALPLLPLVLLVAVAACSAGVSNGSDTPPTDLATDGTGAEGGISAGEGGKTGPDDRGPDGGGGDDVALSFVFVGCNRISKADWDPATNPSAANVPQLQRTLTDIAAMPRTPKFVFFTGDLVLALNKDSSLLAGQLAGWSQLFKAHPVSSKVELIPMTGNHEMLFKDKSSGLELSNPGADQVWTQWLTASGFGAKAGNGPTNAAPNADALQDDQSKLSYSFEASGVHFVVLNTDTWTTTGSTNATELGWIALHWLKADLAAAQANAQISSIFVFGHKPVVNPNGSTLADDAINPALTAGVEAALDGTPKVKAYLAAHAHEWDARKLAGARGVYQVIAGNGGSALEADWAASPPYYGFSEARVYTSGRVGVVSHQRPVPSPYNSLTVAAAKPVPELTIVP